MIKATGSIDLEDTDIMMRMNNQLEFVNMMICY